MFAWLLPACGSQGMPATESAASSKLTASAPASAAQVRDARLAYSTQTGLFMSPFVAREAGIFANHGLNLEIVYTRDGPTALASLVSGEIQFAQLSDPSVTNAALAGSDDEWIAVSTPIAHIALFVQPEIDNVEALKGKTVGVTTLGSLTALFAQRVLQQHGLDPKTDVSIVAVGGGPEAQAAILKRRVDAIIIAPETPLPGKKILVDFTSGGYEFPQGGLVARKRFVASEPQLTQNMVQAFAEGIQRFKSDRALSERVLAQQLGLSNQADVDKAYEEAAKTIVSDVTPRREQIQTVLDLLGPSNPRAKTAHAENFYDDHFAKAVVLPA